MCAGELYTGEREYCTRLVYNTENKTMERKELKPDFLIIPYQLFEIDGLEKLDRDVYAVVYWYEHLKDGECRAANTSIARICRAEPRSVQNSLNRLEMCGCISREYKDATKRNRLRIITHIAYKNVRTTEDTRKTSEPQRIRVRTTEDTASEPQMTIDSNSKKGIKESIHTAAQSAAGDGAMMNKLIEGFREVNPSYTRLYAIKPQRAALGRLVEQHGMEKVQAMIAYLPQSNAARYAPTITSPYDLEKNLGKLIAWAQKQRDTGKAKGMII